MAQYVIIIPTAANVPPIKTTVRYEYLTDKILDNGPVLTEKIHFYLVKITNKHQIT